MIGVEKAFCLEGTTKINRVEIKLVKQNTQADQESDMNIISTSLAKQLSLPLRPLLEIDFLGLCIETADHYETLLKH